MKILKIMTFFENFEKMRIKIWKKIWQIFFEFFLNVKKIWQILLWKNWKFSKKFKFFDNFEIFEFFWKKCQKKFQNVFGKIILKKKIILV